VEQAYDAMVTAQTSRATLEAVSTVTAVHNEASQCKEKIASLEAQLEQTRKELAEEVKRRKALELKVDMVFEWFKAQQR